jgi:SH3 domain protein
MRVLIALLTLLPLVVAAETAYVTDNLRLGLHQAADTGDRAFRTLDSGQELEILSRDRNYAHVRLPEGVQGYVKAAYLVFEPPAKLIVKQTMEERDKLAAQLEQLRAQFAGPAATISALEERQDELQGQLDVANARLVDLDEQNTDLRGRQDQYKYSLPLVWVAGAIGVCLIGGFMLGLWWVDQRSRRRHGGIRIY